MKTKLVIDVPTIEPKLKHPTIFKEFDLLEPGGSLMIHNDHDPKPLFYQLLAERGNTFTWTYEKEGPDFWDVTIAKRGENEKIPTIGQLVAKDFRKAEIFKKYGLDFCCGGKKTVEAACAEKGVEVTALKKELDELDNQSTTQAQDYEKWQSAHLVDHIIQKHHTYVRNSVPILLEFSQKVARVHGDRHPETIAISNLFIQLANELLDHMAKEEAEIFPYFKNIEKGSATNMSVDAAIEAMNNLESEHTLAGELLEEIRNLSSSYSPPVGACGTYRVLYAKLDEFDKDLHTHIHLENNILFPRIK